MQRGLQSLSHRAISRPVARRGNPSGRGADQDRPQRFRGGVSPGHRAASSGADRRVPRCTRSGSSRTPAGLVRSGRVGRAAWLLRRGQVDPRQRARRGRSGDREHSGRGRQGPTHHHRAVAPSAAERRRAGRQSRGAGVPAVGLRTGNPRIVRGRRADRRTLPISKLPARGRGGLRDRPRPRVGGTGPKTIPELRDAPRRAGSKREDTR